MITSSPSALNAGDARIFGTHCFTHVSAVDKPPGRPSLHGGSCPSLHTFGVMYDRFGVVAADCRSVESASNPTTSFAQIGESMIEWKYTHGSWRVAYMSAFGRCKCLVDCVELRMPAGLGLGRRVADVFLVGLPRLAGRVELVGDRLHRLRVDAALPEHLAVGAGAGRCEVPVGHAVALGVGIGRLAADLCDVVVEARVTDREVVREQLALRAQDVR